MSTESVNWSDSCLGIIHANLNCAEALTPGFRIVLEAKRLLSFTNLTVSEISTQLNFEDPSYFARYFKKTIGLSPIEFKNNMSQKYRK